MKTVKCKCGASFSSKRDLENHQKKCKECIKKE